MAITPENMKQLAEVLSDYTLINLCEKYGARPTLKYLRQVSRRSGAANGEVKRQIAYDWEDYIRMAKKVGVDLKVESNRYPLQLARRHNEMMAVIREKDAASKRGTSSGNGRQLGQEIWRGKGDEAHPQAV